MLRVGRPHGRPVDEASKTPIQKSSEVRFYISGNTEEEAATKNWVPLPVTSYVVTLSEPVSFDINTKWKKSGGASIATKLNDLFNSNLIKMLSGDGAWSGTPTDSWTQMITEIGDPIGMKMKFRVYHEQAQEHNSYNRPEEIGKNHSYKDLIKFFTIICAPPVQYTLAEATIQPLLKAAAAAKDVGNKAKAAYDANKQTDGKDTVVKAGLAALNVAWDQVKGQAGLADVRKGPRMNYTLTISKIGNLSFPWEMDWLVKSFTWTPSRQMTIVNGVPEPLWVDFDVDIETTFAPSNAFVSRMFVDNLGPAVMDAVD